MSNLKYETGNCDGTEIYTILEFYLFGEKVNKFKWGLFAVLNLLAFAIGAVIFGLFIASFLKYKENIVKENFNETSCVDKYYDNSNPSVKNPHDYVSINNIVSLLFSTILFTLTLMSKNFLQKLIDSIQFSKMKSLATKKSDQLQSSANDNESKKRISKEYSDNLKSEMKRFNFQLNNSDLDNYAYLFPCAIQYGLIMAYSDDSIYKECVKNSNSEIIFFGLSAFSAFILGLYHLFKCVFILCDKKLVDSVENENIELSEI
jgi:hypothetical protein